MALTQFKFNLIPKAAVLSVHGSVPMKLADYREHESVELPEGEFIHYWKNHPFEEIQLSIKNFLPLVNQWGDKKIYGSRDASKVEIDNEDILVKFDVINADYDFLKKIFDLAVKYECLFVLVETGSTLLAIDYNDLLSALHASRAYRYIQHPEHILDEIKQRNIKH